MKFPLGRIALSAGLALTAMSTLAIDGAMARTSGQDTRTANMRVYGPSQAPIGHVIFCRAYPAECNGATATPRQAILTQERWNELVAINNHVNRTVIPVTDMDLYRTIEHWTYPQGAGDCEDYVLEKQRMLAALGWPIESLLITVVRDENGDGHAILTVTTDQGDLLLDNRRSDILRWQQSGYTFRKRQSQTDPAQWVSLTDTSTGLFSGFWQVRDANVSATFK
ncbi:MAG: transglutaminase-like cysteine peptidase [Fimbriimonadaceae bacterium]|nr:transglutaminase-like cysteine peptidase [Alphaproteobacteria bacterium]